MGGAFYLFQSELHRETGTSSICLFTPQIATTVTTVTAIAGSQELPPNPPTWVQWAIATMCPGSKHGVGWEVNQQGCD